MDNVAPFRLPGRQYTAINLPPVAVEFSGAMAKNSRARELMMLPVDWDTQRMPARALVEIKYDGIHAGFRQDTGAFTREGVAFDACSHLLPGLAAIDDQLRATWGQPHALFGEYVNLSGFEATLADFKRGSGNGVLMLFDAVDLDAYKGRTMSQPLATRRARLKRAYDRVPRNVLGDVGMALSELFVGEARDNIEIAAGEAWSSGLEGIVVKDADSPYVRERSPYWMRLKRTETADLPIVDRHVVSGRLSAFTVRTAAGVDVRVGTGISALLRTAPSLFRTGRIVQVKHLGVTAGGSLRSASFQRFRDDKES